jgi:glycosyltransferase involved in cell wall biosynthesis
MHVLLSVYACQPGKGSEAGVGWNWVRQMARFHEVWAITRTSNAAAILEAVAADPMPNVHWIFFDLPRWARFWKRGERGLRPYYYMWQIGAYRLARRLHAQVHFDLVHHITFVNYWLPSFMALLPVPFIWGPVGGGESAPMSFWYAFSLRGKLYEFARGAARKLACLDPFVRLTAARASVGFSTTSATRDRMRQLGCNRVITYSEAGLSPDEIEQLGKFPVRQPGPVRVVSVGRLLHWKGFDLGIAAFAEFHRQFAQSEYWIFGDGPERQRLESVARRLGVASAVTFWGNQPRHELLGMLADCDILIHPSLHDSGGWVCLEMMAAGRPIVCLDLGGPGVQVTEETGIKVPAIGPAQVIADLAAALLRLAQDPRLRTEFSHNGRTHVRQNFNWNRKGEWMNGVYDYVTQHGPV